MNMNTLRVRIAACENVHANHRDATATETVKRLCGENKKSRTGNELGKRRGADVPNARTSYNFRRKNDYLIDCDNSRQFNRMKKNTRTHTHNKNTTKEHFAPHRVGCWELQNCAKIGRPQLIIILVFLLVSVI